MGFTPSALFVLVFMVALCHGKAVVEQNQPVHHKHRLHTKLPHSTEGQGPKLETSIGKEEGLSETWKVGEKDDPNSDPKYQHNVKQHINDDNSPDESDGDEPDDIDEFLDDLVDDDILPTEGTTRPQLIASDQEPTIENSESSEEESHGTKKDTFHPVKMPTKFESYDVMPKDGFITLKELVNVTGARVNVRLAFNDSDKNGDGLLDRSEFYKAPWKLNPSLSSEDNGDSAPTGDVDMQADDSNLDEEADEDLDENDLFDDDESYDWDDWNDEWNDDEDYWNDMDDADVF